MSHLDLVCLSKDSQQKIRDDADIVDDILYTLLTPSKCSVLPIQDATAGIGLMPSRNEWSSTQPPCNDISVVPNPTPTLPETHEQINKSENEREYHIVGSTRVPNIRAHPVLEYINQTIYRLMKSTDTSPQTPQIISTPCGCIQLPTIQKCGSPRSSGNFKNETRVP